MDIGGLLKSPLKLFVIFFAIIYIISPVDLLPEALLGPIGLIDDFMALMAIFGMLQGKGVRESMGAGFNILPFGSKGRKGNTK